MRYLTFTEKEGDLFALLYERLTVGSEGLAGEVQVRLLNRCLDSLETISEIPDGHTGEEISQDLQVRKGAAVAYLKVVNRALKSFTLDSFKDSDYCVIDGEQAVVAQFEDEHFNFLSSRLKKCGWAGVSSRVAEKIFDKLDKGVLLSDPRTIKPEELGKKEKLRKVR